MGLSDWAYVEVAKYVPKLNSVIREKRNGEAVMLRFDETQKYRDKHSNTGMYTSIFRYKHPNLDAPRVSPLYFDLDSEDLEISHREARLLYQYLASLMPSEIIRTYFTGAKGFHVEVAAQGLGVGPSMNLAEIFRLIADAIKDELKLTTLDFGVYEPRRMWRMPDSIHQKTGMYKVELLECELLGSLSEILELAKGPRHLDEPQVCFSFEANEWFKYWSVVLDEEKENRAKAANARRVELFKKYGSSLVGPPSKKYVDKVWASAIEALRNTEENKDRNLTLNRQAFKLYIMALKTNNDTEDVTNRLYEIGVDIGLEDREVRATLRSAERAATRKYETKEMV